jgi:hypothetical protein
MSTLVRKGVDAWAATRATEARTPRPVTQNPSSLSLFRDVLRAGAILALLATVVPPANIPQRRAGTRSLVEDLLHDVGMAMSL